MRVIENIGALEQLSKQRLLWSSGGAVREESRSNLGDEVGGGLDLQGQSLSALSFKLPEIDRVLPDRGLAFGEVHEFALNDLLCANSAKRRWHPPLLLLSQLLHAKSTEQIGESYLLWVGRRLWPTPQLLAQLGSTRVAVNESPRWFNRSLFIDPHSTEQRLWTMLEALRSAAVKVVIGDGSRFRFIETRKLLLQARKNRAIVLLIRPPWEISHHSSSATKWLVSTCATESEALRWQVELIRARGLGAARSWNIELYEREDGTKNLRCVPSDAQHRSVTGGATEERAQFG